MTDQPEPEDTKRTRGKARAKRRNYAAECAAHEMKAALAIKLLKPQQDDGGETPIIDAVINLLTP